MVSLNFLKRGVLVLLLLPCLAWGTGVGKDTKGAPVHYYVIFYGIQAAHGLNPPEKSHTAATFIRVVDLPGGRKQVEHIDISWLPERYWSDRRLFLPRREPGTSYSIATSLAFAALDGLKVTHYAYPTDERTFQAAADQARFLASGATEYQAFDKFNRKPSYEQRPGGAINCIHAVSDIVGYLPTHRFHGDAATRSVALWYALHGRLRGPADERLYENLRSYVEGPTGEPLPPLSPHQGPLRRLRSSRLVKRLKFWEH